MNAAGVPDWLTPVTVTNEDRKSFQRWLKATKSRYATNRGMRERPKGLRSDHSRITSGSVALGKELRESVPCALAALVVHENREDDPFRYLRPWVGQFQDVAENAVVLLNSERDSLKLLAVFGLWCEDDGCHQFIRPVAVRLIRAPNSFFYTAVCGSEKCQCVTIMWADDDGVWVRRDDKLKGHNHPMRPFDLHRWVQKEHPHPKLRARLISL